MRKGCAAAGLRFLSTSSARRTTYLSGKINVKNGISIHVLREEDDNGRTNLTPLPCIFLSTSSARRTTRFNDHHREMRKISIHVLREEDDDLRKGCAAAGLRFLSTSSARRTTPRPQLCDKVAEFLSTSSARRTTPAYWSGRCGRSISIHVLREEDDHGRGG